jgi:hypothetical protein
MELPETNIIWHPNITTHDKLTSNGKKTCQLMFVGRYLIPTHSAGFCLAAETQLSEAKVPTVIMQAACSTNFLITS